MDPVARTAIEFGRFRVLPQSRQVLADGRPIELGGRAFDVLMTLLEAPGTVISKQSLMVKVWPDRIVEENSLQAQIAALRRALGGDRDLIRTISGRGYQFTGELRRMPSGRSAEAAPGSALAPPARRAPTNLPESLSELIGRETELKDVLSLLATQRLITLTGAGGIGKTRLGLALLRQLLPQFADGVWFAGLASLHDPALVPVTVATALGLRLAGGTLSAEQVAEAMRARQLVLLLDNCEHVLDAAAKMAEALLEASPTARVIATSQEPLRVEGEHVYRLAPLGTPPSDDLETEELLRYDAVRLFLARARAADPHFATDRRAAASIVAICRRLDGIPLAIELAAARTAALRVEEVAERLDDRFALLIGGRRTALARHQTLRATMDWSYELLAEPERAVLRRLAIFAGSFTLEAAGAVAASTDCDASAVVDCVVKLVAKSLVAADVAGRNADYRLLESPRAYALEKLSEGGERQTVARRHAEFYRDLLESGAVAEQPDGGANERAANVREIDNVRAAMDWAFSASGDVSIGLALTVASVPLWMRLSLVDECGRRVERALVELASQSTSDPRTEMRLQAALGASRIYRKGAASETGAAWTKALAIAERIGDVEYRLRSLWGLWAYRIDGGEYRPSLDLARRFCEIAANRSDSADRLIGDRMTGVSLYYLGDQLGARRCIERMLVGHSAVERGSQTFRFLIDQRVMARVMLARVLWLQGFADQAVLTAEAAVEEAETIEHAMSHCNALADAQCTVALWRGDLATAERSVALLLEKSVRHGLSIWDVRARCLHGLVLIRARDAAGLRRFGQALADLRRTPSELRVTVFMGAYAEALADAGRTIEGLATIEEALARSERDEERWCVAELLRIKADILLLQGGEGAANAAETCLLGALEWSRRQGALSWELRAATSLARLRQSQGRLDEARRVLAPIHGGFTEGFGTADLDAAKSVIEGL